MARFSGAPITNMPGPFLWRSREEIKCEPDKEIPFSSDARESEVMIPRPQDHANQTGTGPGPRGQPRLECRLLCNDGTRIAGLSVFIANVNENVKLGRPVTKWVAERARQAPGLSTGASASPSLPCIFQAK